MEQRFWYIFAGTYSDRNQDSLHLLKFDSETGRLVRLNGISGVDNPSYLSLDSKGSHLFAVSETDNGAVVSIAFDRVNGTMKEINKQPTKGAAPCYISLGQRGKQLFATNYESGSVCLYPIEDNGKIGPLTDHIQHSGHSIHSGRQGGPHPHSIVPVPDSDFLLVPDLGTDRIFVYRNDVGQSRIIRHDEIICTAGSGPRHAAFHPTERLVYVIHELNSTISVHTYDHDTGLFSMVQSVSTLPENFIGGNTASDIHVSPSGCYLYGSNRGHDSIVVFEIQENGRLELVGYSSTKGKTPRNFAITPDGEFLLAANQDSDSIVVMKLTHEGLPVPTGAVLNIPKPVCLKAVAMHV